MNASATSDLDEVSQFNICLVQDLFEKTERCFSQWKTKEALGCKKQWERKKKIKRKIFHLCWGQM